MDRQELTDIVLRNIGGSIVVLKHYRPRRRAGLVYRLSEIFSKKSESDEQEKGEIARHHSYLDAIREYYDEHGNRHNALLGVQNFLVSQHDSFDPDNMCYAPRRLNVSNLFVKITNYTKFLMIAAPFIMFNPYNYLIGGVGMASLIVNKLVKRFTKEADERKNNFAIQAKGMEEDFREKREAIRALRLSEFESVLQEKKDLILSYL